MQETDTFSEYSGYIQRETSGGGADWDRYDPEVMGKYFRGRPFLVGRRLAQIGSVLSLWFGKRWLDAKTGRAEENFKMRAEELRAALQELGPAFVKIAAGSLLPPGRRAPAYLEQVCPTPIYSPLQPLLTPHCDSCHTVSIGHLVMLGVPLAFTTPSVPVSVCVFLRCTLPQLSLLQDRIAPFSTADALDIVESELGAPMASLFSEISPQPVAAASLGQVYQARLAGTGQAVALKVQRPGVRAAIALDIYILRCAYQ